MGSDAAFSRWQGAAVRVLGALYRDRTGAEWGEPLEEVARMHGATWAHVHIDSQSVDDVRFSVLNSSADPGILDRIMQSGLAAADPRVPAMSGLDGEARACWQMLDPADFEASAFYRVVLAQPANDIRWCIGSGATLESGDRLLFGVSRPQAMGAFEPAEVAAFGHFTPHLTGAVAMHESLRIAERLVQAGMSRHEAKHLGTGVLVLDRRLRLVFADEVGGQFLERHGMPSKSAPGTVALRSAPLQHALETTARRAEDGRAFMISEGEHVLKFFSLPQMETLSPGALAPARVLVEIRRIAADTPVRLTRREAEIATMLADGMKLSDIAAARGKSIDTVRSQLKSAMRKLSVNSQAQLVRQMLRRS